MKAQKAPVRPGIWECELLIYALRFMMTSLLGPHPSEGISRFWNHVAHAAPHVLNSVRLLGPKSSIASAPQLTGRSGRVHSGTHHNWQTAVIETQNGPRYKAAWPLS